MNQRIDLHCHWVPGVDDGVRSEAESAALLTALQALGFACVTATPHMRTALWPSTAPFLKAAYQNVAASAVPDGLTTLLGSEHHFDDVTFPRLLAHEGLPYGSGDGERNTQALLVELPDSFPLRLVQRLRDVQKAGYKLVIAHPERYRSVWDDDSSLDPMLDMGAHLLLDIGSIIGKYGQKSQELAFKLLDEGAYEAACTDAHRPADAEMAANAMAAAEKRVGKAELERLFVGGPRTILGM
jgi:protein-tyrosine phosphatase